MTVWACASGLSMALLRYRGRKAIWSLISEHLFDDAESRYLGPVEPGFEGQSLGDKMLGSARGLRRRSVSFGLSTLSPRSLSFFRSVCGT